MSIRPSSDAKPCQKCILYSPRRQTLSEPDPQSGHLGRCYLLHLGERCVEHGDRGAPEVAPWPLGLATFSPTTWPLGLAALAAVTGIGLGLGLGVGHPAITLTLTPVWGTGRTTGEAKVADGGGWSGGVDPPPPPERGGWVGRRVVTTRPSDTYVSGPTVCDGA
eukprot:scaffold101397_cov36-Phaeocystis_antarctica.AAC.1